MWTCPTCGRAFRNAQQNHSCRLISKEMLFAKRPPVLYEIYQKLIAAIATFGEFREETVPPDVIFLKTKSSFGAIKVKKAHLEVEFFLDHLEDVPPVTKHLQTSTHRVAHVVPVDDVADVDEQLVGWLRSAYVLITSD